MKRSKDMIIAIKRELAFLKEATSLEGSFTRSLSLGDGGGSLMPIGTLQRHSPVYSIASDWIDDADKVAFSVLNQFGVSEGVLGFVVDEELSVMISLLDGVAGSDALEVLATWAIDSLYVSEVRAVDIDSELLSNAGFIENVFVPKQARSVGEALILTAGPSISMREGSYAYDAARYGWNHQWSKYLNAFEEKFASFVGRDYAISTSSCTGALTIALTALEIGPGDEVIVPDLTWVATANAVRYVGAKPVFCDVELDSWNMDAAAFASAITPQTKAVIAVHMYGHPARMDGIVEVARKNGLHIVEDAAPAIGAEWQGQRCGTFGDFAAFSFQGAKLLVTGEGGMLVTSNPELHEKAQKIADQGRNPNKVFWIDGHGVKYKMSNVQAAVGLAQLERCEELVAMKRRVFDWYHEGLADNPFVHLNHEVEDAYSIYWMSSLRVEEEAPLSRDDLRTQLRERNVDTRPVFPAISQYPIWGYETDPQATALRVGRQAVNLPSGVCLRREQVAYICDQINTLLS